MSPMDTCTHPTTNARSLWRRYAPRSLDDLVGAQSVIRNLQTWLQNWDAVHITKQRQVKYEKSNPGAKAALLSGPPGIGKTTSARLVAGLCGRSVMELNASDTRSKKLIAEGLANVVQVGVLDFDSSNVKRVIVMDEVDGMSASDRGGVQELIRVIKISKTPIICICNDMSKSAVRSLANHCYDLRFQRPHVSSILKRVKEICRKEKLQVEDEALQGMVQSTGNDIRQMLNALQMWSVSDRELTDKDARSRIGEINKDAIQRLSGFDATRFIFCESHSKPVSKLYDAFFVDYDLIPLMVAQNCVAAAQASKQGEMEKMTNIQKAADAIVDADIVSRYVRMDQRWDLLTSQAMLNVRAAYTSNGPIGFPGFPEWLGKQSNANKRARLLSELTNHARCSSTATSLDRRSLRFDYIPAMREVFVRPLAVTGTQEVVNQVINYLDEYSMSRDDLFDTLAELQFESAAPGFKDHYKSISSQTKASFTREYNKRSHRSQVLVGEEGMSKKVRRTKAAAVEEEEQEEEAEEEEEDVNWDAFRPKGKSSARTKSTEKADKTGTKKRKRT